MDSRQDHAHKMSRLIAQAWIDPQLRAELVSNPKKIMRDAGIEVSDDVEITVLESSDKKVYMVIPPAPTVEFTETRIKDIAGRGDWSSTRGTDEFSKGCYTTSVA